MILIGIMLKQKKQRRSHALSRANAGSPPEQKVASQLATN
jgi:hypothetical protein